MCIYIHTTATELYLIQLLIQHIHRSELKAFGITVTKNYVKDRFLFSPLGSIFLLAVNNMEIKIKKIK